MKQLSIAISNYNNEAYLLQCFNSLKYAYLNSEQTFNIEFLLIDDGSSDTSLELMKKIKVTNPFFDVRIIKHINNATLSKTRYTAIRAAKYDYITFFDSDDYATNDFFKALEKHRQDYDMLAFSWKRSDDSEIVIVDSAKNLYHHNTWGKVFKLSLFDNLKFYKMNSSEDQAIMHNVMTRAENIVYEPTIMLIYRVNESSMTGTRNDLYILPIDYWTSVVYRIITSNLQNIDNHPHPEILMKKVQETTSMWVINKCKLYRMLKHDENTKDYQVRKIKVTKSMIREYYWNLWFFVGRARQEAEAKKENKWK